MTSRKQMNLALVTAHHVNERYRLRENFQKSDTDISWFDYEEAIDEKQYNAIAIKVVNLLQIKDINWIHSLFN